MRLREFFIIATFALAESVTLAGVPPAPVAPAPSEAAAATVRKGEIYYHLMQARLDAGGGRVAEALAELREAAALEPDSAELHAESAAFMLSLGKRTEAERMARRALEIDSGSSVALRVLADLAASKALGPNPDDASRQEAIRLYGRLAAMPDADDDVLAILARLKLGAGDKAGALETARALVDRRPADTSAIRLLAQILLQDGREAEALQALNRFLSVGPPPDEIVELVAELARKIDDWTGVEAACSGLVRSQRDTPAVRALHGEALLRLGRNADAIPELEEASRLDPGKPLIRFQLATAYGEAGRLADAEQIARQLDAEFPGNPGVRTFLGELLARQGDSQGALKALEGALEGLRADPQGAAKRDEIRLRMAAVHLAAGRGAQAAKILGSLEEPEQPEALQLQGRVALATKDANEASRVARQLRAKQEPGAAALIEGEILADEGHADKALAKFEEAASAIGSRIWTQAAEILRRTGHPDIAESALRK